MPSRGSRGMLLLSGRKKSRDRVNSLDGFRRDSDLVSETRVPRHAVLPMVVAMASFRGGFE